MAAAKSSFNVNKVIKIGMEYATLNITNQVLNQIPNIPPAVKLIAGIGVSARSYQILSKSLDMLPSSIRGIGKAVIGIQSTLLIVQQIPNLLDILKHSEALGYSPELVTGAPAPTNFIPR